MNNLYMNMNNLYMDMNYLCMNIYKNYLLMNYMNNYNTNNFKINYNMAIPMKRFNQYNMNNNSNNNANTNISDRLLNILPRDNSDLKSFLFYLYNSCIVQIIINRNETLKDLFKVFALKFGIGEKFIGKEIFLFLMLNS